MYSHISCCIGYFKRWLLPHNPTALSHVWALMRVRAGADPAVVGNGSLGSGRRGRVRWCAAAAGGSALHPAPSLYRQVSVGLC